MEYDEALELKEKWHNRPCDHRCVEEEFYRKNLTGALVCSQCGNYVSEEYREKMIKDQADAESLMDWMEELHRVVGKPETPE